MIPSLPKRLRRALLFMPGDDLNKIQKGAASGVDSVIMDLEDGVAYKRKAEARNVTANALRTLDFGRSERLVRVNPVGTPFFADDLAAILPARPDGIVIPKLEGAAQLETILTLLSFEEQRQGWPHESIRVIGIIESALGVIVLRELVGSRRLDALAFGAEDYAASIGASRSPGGLEVLYGRSAVVAYAAAYGLGAIDTPYINLNDEIGLNEDAGFAASLGYTGKFVIHPKQVAAVERAFNPTESAIRYAMRVIEADGQQQDKGTGVFELDGKMIDMPMVRSAQKVVDRARAAGLMLPLI